MPKKPPPLEPGAYRKARAWECHCAKCGHVWTTAADEIPEYCPGCRKDTWWLKRPRGRPPAMALRPEMWTGAGAVMQLDEAHAIQFEVKGPQDERVLLRKDPDSGKWRIVRSVGRAGRMMEGPAKYATHQEAFAAFAAEFDESSLDAKAPIER